MGALHYSSCIYSWRGKSHIRAADWSGGALHYLDLRLFQFCGQRANKGVS